MNGSQRRIAVATAIAACATSALLAGQAAASTATTTPGVSALIPVILTNSTIKVAADKFTLKTNPKLARYPRGATITFKIQNEGTEPLTVVLRVLTKFHFYEASELKTTESTGKIAPTRIARLRATFTFRGKYEFELMKKGKIVARSPISVF